VRPDNLLAHNFSIRSLREGDEAFSASDKPTTIQKSQKITDVPAGNVDDVGSGDAMHTRCRTAHAEQL